MASNDHYNDIYAMTPKQHAARQEALGRPVSFQNDGPALRGTRTEAVLVRSNDSGIESYLNEARAGRTRNAGSLR